MHTLQKHPPDCSRRDFVGMELDVCCEQHFIWFRFRCANLHASFLNLVVEGILKRRVCEDCGETFIAVWGCCIFSRSSLRKGLQFRVGSFALTPTKGFDWWVGCLALTVQVGCQRRALDGHWRQWWLRLGWTSGSMVAARTPCFVKHNKIISLVNNRISSRHAPLKLLNTPDPVPGVTW